MQERNRPDWWEVCGLWITSKTAALASFWWGNLFPPIPFSRRCLWWLWRIAFFQQNTRKDPQLYSIKINHPNLTLLFLSLSLSLDSLHTDHFGGEKMMYFSLPFYPFMRSTCKDGFIVEGKTAVICWKQGLIPIWFSSVSYFCRPHS